MNDMLYKLLKEVKSEEQEIQRKGLSPAFISFLVKLVLSIPAAGTFLGLWAYVLEGEWVELDILFGGLGFISALTLIIIAPKNGTMETKIVKIILWILCLVSIIWKIMGYWDSFTIGVSALLAILAFTLTLTLMMLLFAYYKIGGVDEGWTVDRATGAEKLAISLWILSLVLVMCLLISTADDYKVLVLLTLGVALMSKLPGIAALLVVFLVNIMSIRKNRLSKIKELAMKEARENKDESI